MNSTRIVAGLAECPICNGTGTPRVGRPPCMCLGTGHLEDAFRNLQELYFREKNEHETTRTSLVDIQKAVLDFIFNPQFQRMDRTGFMKRYWDGRLNCTISVNRAGTSAGGAEGTRVERQEAIRI